MQKKKNVCIFAVLIPKMMAIFKSEMSELEPLKWYRVYKYTQNCINKKRL